MASPPANNPYTYQSASTTATRALLTSTKPTEIPSSSSNDITTTSAKETLQRRTTNHYEQAASAATQTGQLPATTAGSVAASVADGPGMPKRQQSWKMSDFKGQLQEQMLASGVVGGHGFSGSELKQRVDMVSLL